MRVLSLFDGCGMAYQALKNMGVTVTSYDACEIDKYAIQVAKKNHPDINHLGDVRLYNPAYKIDLLIGGSPCQNLSAAGNGTGLEGAQSGLFYEYARILEETKPDWFVLENVASMSRKNRDIISQTLGVEPVKIDSALVSAQSRKRYYWTNIPNITQPEDRQIYLKDIIEDGVVDRDKSYCVSASFTTTVDLHQYFNKRRMQVVFKPDRIGELNSCSRGQRVYSLEGKSITLSASTGGWGTLMGLYLDKSCARRLTPVECERLQTLPDNYTQFGAGDKEISRTQRYKMLGNGFTVAVIEHILSFMEPQ